MRFLLSRFRKDKRGTAAIEFGMLVLPFIAVIMSLLEVTTVFIVDQSFDSAVHTAARQIRTGEVHKASLDKQAFANAICANLTTFNKCSENLTINVQSYPSFTDAIKGGKSTLQAAQQPGGLDPAKTAYNVGGGSSVVVVQAFMKLPLFVLANIGIDIADKGSNSITLISNVVVKNEPFT